ncbi:MAG: S-layer homology domain-containing protein [Eubacteriales bacterium]|nr:S-layer homology domain-containing protein [Eubacteriales bacterium]
MKRKFLAMLLVLALCLVPTAMAADELLVMPISANSARVFVTIADAGSFVLVEHPVIVSDVDGDGVLTICDALAAVHDDAFEGGAKAGFAYAETEYGLSLTKLWGVENGGSYGYYINDASAFSLGDEIHADDRIYAYTYADLTAWSDAYTYFDTAAASVEAGSDLTLTLTVLGYDADWNLVASPFEGAVITVNGEATDVVTDKDGRAVLTFADADSFVVSAASETSVIVPPVCIVEVTAAAEKPAADAPAFEDVADSDWFSTAVKTAAEAGLVVGKGNRFDSEANMTVAEYLTIIYRMGESEGLYEGRETTGANWQDGAKYAAETLGYEVSDYNAAILREEMAGITAAYLKALAGDEEYVTVEPIDFSDIADSAYAESIVFMQSIGAIGGYNDGTFRPTNTIRRCEVAQVVCNMMTNVEIAG